MQWLQVRIFIQSCKAFQSNRAPAMEVTFRSGGMLSLFFKILSEACSNLDS